MRLLRRIAAAALVLIPLALAGGQSMPSEAVQVASPLALSISPFVGIPLGASASFFTDFDSHHRRMIESETLLGRNAMTWDDNRKAAAYVTSKDPCVLGFARSMTSFIRGQEKRAINENLQAAIALHEALDLHGINYVPNPVTPYSEASKSATAVDFLQFPRETFQHRAGGCSDLSILYSALLQAVGVDTAFVTVPGHIFLAVSAGLTPEAARGALLPADQLIVQNGIAWIPVEITLRREGFMSAWALGMREWNTNAPSAIESEPGKGTIVHASFPYPPT